MNVYCKFANIGRNIFLNRIGVYRNLRIFDEIFFRIAKLVFLFQSGCIPRSAWNIGIIFFFFSLIGTPSSIWKRSWQRIFATSKIQRDFYAFSWNSIDSLPARQNQLIWNIGIIFLFHRLLVNVRQKIPKDILEFWKLKNTCTCSHGIS